MYVYIHAKGVYRYEEKITVRVYVCAASNNNLSGPILAILAILVDICRRRVKTSEEYTEYAIIGLVLDLALDLVLDI